MLLSFVSCTLLIICVFLFTLIETSGSAKLVTSVAAHFVAFPHARSAMSKVKARPPPTSVVGVVKPEVIQVCSLTSMTSVRFMDSYRMLQSPSGLLGSPTSLPRRSPVTSNIAFTKSWMCVMLSWLACGIVADMP
jgi:hypothetical protein